MPKEPRKVGITNGKFFPCPEKHVCVSTQSPKEDEVHYIEPIKYSGSREEAKQKILKIINSLKRTKVLKEENNYIHATFTTGLFKFTDDVEFYFEEAEKIIHFRSQSRIGGYDWNANRKRMEKIRNHFQK